MATEKETLSLSHYMVGSFVQVMPRLEQKYLNVFMGCTFNLLSSRGGRSRHSSKRCGRMLKLSLDAVVTNINPVEVGRTMRVEVEYHLERVADIDRLRRLFEFSQAAQFVEDFTSPLTVVRTLICKSQFRCPSSVAMGPQQTRVYLRVIPCVNHDSQFYLCVQYLSLRGGVSSLKPKSAAPRRIRPALAMTATESESQQSTGATSVSAFDLPSDWLSTPDDDIDLGGSDLDFPFEL
jgi:hypothetical protein